MSEDPINALPTHLQRLINTGRKADGSYVVSVLFRVTPNDDLALRGEYLVEPAHVVSGEAPADWGGESAVVQHIAQIVHYLRDDKVTFGQSDVICGEFRARVPPAP